MLQMQIQCKAELYTEYFDEGNMSDFAAIPLLLF